MITPNTKYKKEEKKIPTLRFPGFEGDWEFKKFGEIVKNISSGKIKPEKEGRFIVYGSTGVIGRCNKFSHNGKYLLVARVGANAGTINCVEGVFGVTDNTLVIDPQESVDLDFTHSALLRFNLNKLIFGSGQPLITGGQLKSIRLTIPSLPEQQKIASFLSAVDQKIQQLTRKKELLELYKKGVMQKIFPPVGGQAPEIRFKDENGNDFPDWEVIRAKDVFKNHSNKNHNGDLPILAASQKRGMVYRDSIDIQIKSSEASVKSYKVVEKGDFVISLRSFQGGIEYSYLNGICSPAYTILKPVIPIIDAFFKFYFKKEDFIERLSKTIIGIRDGKQITYENFGWLKLNIPSNAEQQKISLFLSNIDNKIESIKTQINQTQKFKKGLLQQMFV